MNDFMILGGGIAGACAGYFLAEHGSVALIEMEDAPGYHSTGRSAALFSEYYGKPLVRALTAASRAFFETPPAGFAAHPLLTPRGVVTLAPAADDARFTAMLNDCRDAGAREIALEEARQFCPIVNSACFSRAMYKPAAMDIDVDALHQGFLRGLRAKGGVVITGAQVDGLERRGGVWHAASAAGDFSAPVVVNAAGAWADDVARLAGVRPIGLMPKRRTALVVDPPAGMQVAHWPMVADVGESFYFKPEAGRLLISPADATPTLACDVQPDELDVALAVARMEEVTTLRIPRIAHKWAGLRNFVPDDLPVAGQAVDAPGFLWLAALGGYGIQIAPGLGRAIAALATAQSLPQDLLRAGINAAMLSPARLP